VPPTFSSYAGQRGRAVGRRCGLGVTSASAGIGVQFSLDGAVPPVLTDCHAVQLALYTTGMLNGSAHLTAVGSGSNDNNRPPRYQSQSPYTMLLAAAAFRGAPESRHSRVAITPAKLRYLRISRTDPASLFDWAAPARSAR